MQLFEGFVHPALAFGALLAAVPLVIHLLNRQRHRPLQWAAMRFVLAAYRRTRRRAQIENLILLLLRMAAVALLALAVARPFTDSSSPLAPLTESRRDLVLIVDASASTGYRESVRSVFEAELERAREILASFDGTRGDRVRLIAAGAHPRLLSARSPEDALTLLSTLSAPTDERLDLAATLSEVAKLADEDAAGAGQSALEVRLLTDLQRRSFVAQVADVEAETDPEAEPEGAGGEPAAGVPPLERALDRLEELGVRVVVEDLGTDEPSPPNLGVVAVEPSSDLVGAGLTSEVTLTVQNFGSQGRAAVRVALEIDGVRQPSQKLDVPARSRADVVFPVTFADSGYHSLAARLEGDRLAVDDSRARIVHVPPPERVLLVNGDPHPEIDLDEVGYLRAILEPRDDGALGGPGGFSPFSVETVTAAAFGGDLDLSLYDVFVLANVGALAPQVIEQLEARVAAGASLLISMGNRFDDSAALESFNARLWRPDGTGLLPARLFRKVDVPERRETYFRVARFDEEHPALAFFADERWRPYLTEAPIYAFVACAPGPDADVLASLDDADKSPLLVERAYDRGRVFLWTTTIDDAWTDIPDSPTSFIPLTHELLRYAGHGRESRREIGVGDTLVAEVTSFPRTPSLVRPDGTRRQLDGEPAEVAEGVWHLPAIGPVDRVGIWAVESEGAPDYRFAVNLDPREGDLSRLTPEELEAEHPAWRFFRRGSRDVSSGDDQPNRGELWRWFAGVALAALVLETLWAAWVGRVRRSS